MQTIDALIQIAKAAGTAVIQARVNGLSSKAKAPGEVTTNADLASHEVIIEHCSQFFPGIPMITEESQEHRIPDSTLLVADELDGTAPFTVGSKHWGVMLAIIDTIPTHGVIYLPDLSITISAEIGNGCQINEKEVLLQQDKKLSESLVGVELNRFLIEHDWQLLRALSLPTLAIRSTACAAVSTFELLTGITSAYINLRGGKIWDFAAPALAISEAGGRVCAPDGKDLNWNEIKTSFTAGVSATILDEWLGIYRNAMTSNAQPSLPADARFTRDG